MRCPTSSYHPTPSSRRDRARRRMARFHANLTTHARLPQQRSLRRQPLLRHGHGAWHVAIHAVAVARELRLGALLRARALVAPPHPHGVLLDHPVVQRAVQGPRARARRAAHEGAALAAAVPDAEVRAVARAARAPWELAAPPAAVRLAERLLPLRRLVAPRHRAALPAAVRDAQLQLADRALGAARVDAVLRVRALVVVRDAVPRAVAHVLHLRQARRLPRHRHHHAGVDHHQRLRAARRGSARLSLTLSHRHSDRGV
mmetsp:Transcript_32804/g.68748  ORF Transcript_32804/g.68748 Transcript_32804/m.68748 type:complete len:259 (-) Transcript_32804:319-1095(-)